MPYALAPTRHAARVRDAVEGRLPAPSGSARLASSWQRSFERYQLDPGSVIGPRVLSAAELREIRDREESFLRASGQCLTRLHDVVRDADYCVMLTDAHGVTIDYRIDRERRNDFKHAGLHIGSCWSESEEGTCGIASVLADLAPITVHKTDHFRAAFTTLTCSAAPIFAPGGELIGVLDASAVQSPDGRESQRIVNQLVRQSATLIEDGYFLHRTASCWILFGHQSRNYVEAQPELLIAFDENGNVVAANRRAREIIPGLEGPRHIDEIFDSSHVQLRDIGRIEAIAALRLRASGAMLYARIRAPLGRVPSPGVHGAVPLRDVRDAPQTRAEEAHDRSALGPFLRSADARVADNARIAQRVVGKRLPILLLGETGAGKEVFARAIHDAGPRRNRPFVAVNCGALPESLIESELFGYAPGAFTGARRHGARGKIALADGGTLFLDEIGDMPLALQTRLLRVLAEGEVLPLGGETPVRVDLDVICATHRDLTQMAAAGAFRDDLYYRLSGAVLTLPPLRERRDIGMLIDTVFAEEAQAAGRPLGLDAALAAQLAAYAWPGNLRQLRNAMRYACAVCDTVRVEARHLSADLAAQLPDSARGGAMASREGDRASTRAERATGHHDSAERARILAALTAHRWRPDAAAAALGISRATLYRRIAKHGIVGPHRA
ncbi:MAG: sigma-54-dependent Fis family transcriptional regulator [Paraburkholderia tropica]|uniref:GAF modulated Fis family sigma54 specific transcriptional regulator n=1 Tax=Paraburkholderia tropica TaxID=92647 RepID=A0AAQ1GH37_9BURK|nr:MULTISPECIES: sigma-54-dependent Fis family transcriptional regulator [Paraburkholderia]MBB3002589.1 transcriptional regulator of acetoin/glycerol metabolism [Paraburkholderia tropica]MBB6317720.1 transcriptional regulator of acetoin/glycerol metabolism [Paraburkholderia tropica]MDE1140993.1 sigma-54-dependent Fis family transcriptional regulator [Paraburkholderia tropica]PXX14611.1 GAF modulated Fis family sigma54 specific transcriptional regulator [Paraburkholderia tropica]PZW79676.1 GAF 